MSTPLFELKGVYIEPVSTHLYVPPIVWKGDSVGHVGVFDVFFFVVEGKCFLNVEGQSYIIREGQIAFLPRGKMRQYTQISEKFSMYEIRFKATVEGENLMSALGLGDSDLVVDMSDNAEVRGLFERSAKEEMNTSPVFSLSRASSFLEIISLYASARSAKGESNTAFFRPVLEYMSNNMKKEITLSELSSLLFMHDTYFVKRFKDTFSLPPLQYLNQLRIYRSMGLLSGTSLSVEQIAEEVGIPDPSYFARVFKKHTSTTPTEYRSAFKR